MGMIHLIMKIAQSKILKDDLYPLNGDVSYVEGPGQLVRNLS